MLEISRLKALEKIIEEEQLNEYIRWKKEIVKKAIEEILNWKENNVFINIPQKIEFQNFLEVLHFFFWKKSINELNGYGIYFIINFLKCCNETKFEEKSLQELKKTISKESLEKLIWDGEKWEREREKRSLRELWLWEALERFKLD